MFQSDGHNPIDLSAFHTEATPPPVAARPRFRFPRARRPQPPTMPEPPGFPKRAKAPKIAQPPKARGIDGDDDKAANKRRDKDKERPLQPPIATPPPGTWPPGPEQVSLPASVAFVVWKVLVVAAVVVFYVVKFMFHLALRPFLYMID